MLRKLHYIYLSSCVHACREKKQTNKHPFFLLFPSLGVRNNNTIPPAAPAAATPALGLYRKSYCKGSFLPEEAEEELFLHSTACTVTRFAGFPCCCTLEGSGVSSALITTDKEGVVTVKESRTGIFPSILT